MAIIGGQIGYRILKFIAARSTPSSKGIDEDSSGTTLETSFGETFFQDIEGKTVIDFGCGPGHQAVEMAQKGAAKVIGLDIQERLLESGRKRSMQLGVSDCCIFTTKASEPADIIISKDAFEHFSNPAEILKIMSLLLKPQGYVLASFGPTWLHPYGGHLFSVFPWSHLIFTEKSQIRW